MAFEIDNKQLWKRPSTSISKPNLSDSIFDVLGLSGSESAQFEEYAAEKLADAQDAVYNADCVRRSKKLASSHGIKAYCYESDYNYTPLEVRNLYNECERITNYLIDVCNVYQTRVKYLKLLLQIALLITLVLGAWFFTSK